jgi:hypothetical protein
MFLQAYFRTILKWTDPFSVHDESIPSAHNPPPPFYEHITSPLCVSNLLPLCAQIVKISEAATGLFNFLFPLLVKRSEYSHSHLLVAAGGDPSRARSEKDLHSPPYFAVRPGHSRTRSDGGKFDFSPPSGGGGKGEGPPNGSPTSNLANSHDGTTEQRRPSTGGKPPLRRRQGSDVSIASEALGHRGTYTNRTEVDCQKASMMGAHSCGDLVYKHTSERSPTAALAKRA